MKILSHPRYPRWLLVVFIGYWLIWAYKPSFPRDFVVEHLLTAAWVGLLVWAYRRFPLSNVSYTLIFIHLCLHTIGAHYTYAEVPYDQWFKDIFGVTLNSLFGWTRNHYDRLVHFAFGLLLAYPIREYFLRIVNVRGFWGYYLPLDVTMSFSMLYELMEWGIAVLLAPDVGQAYLGTQGDVWDSQKDMALATLGALISMCVVAFINWKFNRRFGREIAESLAVKQPKPLGERKLLQWLQRKR